MNVEDCRAIAAKMNQHMEHLITEGVNDDYTVIDRMIGYVPELHQIWTDTVDYQRIALSEEFPEFYRYARLMEKLVLDKRNRSYFFYDEIQDFSELHKKLIKEILTTSATIEREFMAVLHAKELVMSYPEMAELNTLYSRWQNDGDFLKNSIQADADAHKKIDYVNKLVNHLATRINGLVKRIVEKGDEAKKRQESSARTLTEVVTSLQQCKHCGNDIALLIYGDRASDMTGLKVYAQAMADNIKKTNLPTYVLAAPSDPSYVDAPSMMLKVHPTIEDPFFITPDEWSSRIAKISNEHCKP